MTTYDLTTTTPTSIKTGDIINVPYSGTVKSISLPKGTFKLQVWGAQGGSQSTTYVGGKGGYSVGTLTLAEETLVYCRAGGKGSTTTSTGTVQGGGFNGGGGATTTSASYYTNGGGGGSDIRLRSDSLYARVIVAGGGGGAHVKNIGYGNGGAGGGTSGGTGVSSSSSYKPGTGGSQTARGSSYYGTTANSKTYATLATFGSGASAKTSSSYSCGGGGGWYGGGSARRAGGGGGSGYVYTSGTAGNYPSGCLLTSVDYLTDASTTIGTSSFVGTGGSNETGHADNGYCRITVLDAAGLFVSFMHDGTEVSSVKVEDGDTVDAPDYDPDPSKKVSWQDADGNEVTFPYTFTGDESVTFYCVLKSEASVIAYDSGTVVLSGSYTVGSSIEIADGTKGTGTFVGWWDGATLWNDAYTVPETGTVLLARYDMSGSTIVVDSVGLQPNPIKTGATVLLSVVASSSESEVPRWGSFAVTADGLPMSSPYQAVIWDTSEPGPLATFEADGIETAGMDTPPIEAMTVPLPRVGLWSDAISGSDGSISWAITGTVDSEYTSSIVVKSPESCYIAEATIAYTSSSGTVTESAVATAGTLSFPSGTYSSFVITVTKVSGAYMHARVMDIAPGGA